MINKIYEKSKTFIKENYKVLLVYLAIIFLFTYKLPYYIYTGGGVIDTSDKIKIQDEYKIDGKLNFAYVETRNAIIPLYLLALINPDWDIEEQSTYKVTDADTLKDLDFRDKIDLKKSIENATVNAYKLLDKEIEIKSSNNYIIYIKDKEKTNLKVSDVVLEVDNIKIDDILDIRSIINSKEVGDKVKLKVKRNKKEINCYATVYLEENTKIIGIGITTINDLVTNPKLEINFNRNESGPSGGLMLGLTIYDKLTEEDLTKGLNIVGTGTIDEDGKIGAIGGVKYKLVGAVKNKADVFIVPNEENYDECIKIQKEKNYNIKIIGVDTLEDAINKINAIK